MTEKKKISRIDAAPSAVSAFHLEANRSVRGMALMIGGIIGISDFSEERVMLMSHSGRVIIEGKRLAISIYENKNVEVTGRVEEIKFTYGKN